MVSGESGGEMVGVGVISIFEITGEEVRNDSNNNNFNL